MRNLSGRALGPTGSGGQGQKSNLFLMIRTTREDVLSRLEAVTHQLHGIGDDDAFVDALGKLAAALNQDVLALLEAREQNGDLSSEARLWRRAINDYAALQAQLAGAQAFLFDRPLFINTLQRKGSEIASMKVGLTFSAALDQTLQHVVHLMQYDTHDRTEIDVRNGFKVGSGSAAFARSYFGSITREPESGD